MNFFIGVTDNKWFELLSSTPDVDEVNFWQPSGGRSFKTLNPGEPFLFKLHSPLNFIVGGGFFAHFSILPTSLAWEAFEEKNGAENYEQMRQRIIKYKRSITNPDEDFHIGCIILEQPFFFERKNWIPIPSNWKPNIVVGKRYSAYEEPGKSLWEQIELRIHDINLRLPERRIGENLDRYAKETSFRPRLGQGSFKVLVTDAYMRRCAVTEEKILPVLEAAHIKPYSKGGEHRIDNGVLLRSDMHRLLDKGYMTITTDLHIEMSQRIKDEFDNGKYYFTFHGKEISRPMQHFDQPAKEFLEWHNENIFKSL